MGEIEKPIYKKILDIFFEDDFKTMKSNVWTFIVKPNLKQIAYNICLGAVNQAFKNKATPAGNVGTQYNRTATGQVVQPTDFRTSYQTPVAKVSDWKNVTVDSPEKATEVANHLLAGLRSYPYVTIADLFSEAEIQCDDPVANNWGWDNLDGISWVGTLTGKYRIVLPSDPKPIKK